MIYVLRNFSRWCFAGALLVFCVVSSSLTAQTLTSTRNGSSVTATVTGISVNTSTRVVTVTVSSTFVNAFGYRGVTWLGPTNSASVVSQQIANGSQGSGPIVASKTFMYPVGGTVNAYLGTFVFQTSGDNTAYDLKSVAIPLSAEGGLQPAPTLSPSGGAAAILTGQTFNGTASGRLGSGAYNISITSGSGSASINATTGAYTVTAGATGGLINYIVWVSAGGGYARSADASANIAVSLSKKVTVTIPSNTSPNPILYTLSQGGVDIGTYLQPAGASAFIKQIDVGNNDGPVTVRSTVTGVIKEGPNFIYTGDPADSVDTDVTSTVTPSTDTTPNPIAAPPVTSAVSVVAPSGQGGLVWTPGNGSADPEQQKDLLTNSVFREGINLTVKAQTATSEAFFAFLDDQKVEKDNTPTTAQMQTEGGAAKGAIEGQINALEGSAAQTVAPTPSGGGLTLNGGASFASFTETVSVKWLEVWNYLAPVFMWIKEIIRYVIMIWYVMWIFKEIEIKMYQGATAPQAKGNPAIAGTGAQLTALTAAGLITTVIFTMPVILWGAYHTNLPAGVLMSIPSAPIATGTHPSLAVAMGWLATALPLDTILQVAPAVILMRKAGAAILMGVLAVIRFIVP